MSKTAGMNYKGATGVKPITDFTGGKTRKLTVMRKNLNGELVEVKESELERKVRNENLVLANTRKTLKRATDVIVAFNRVLFNKKDRSLDDVIKDLSECSYKLNGMRENKVTMLLKELKEWRRIYGQLPNENKDGERAPVADEEKSSEADGPEPADAGGDRSSEEVQLNYES